MKNILTAIACVALLGLGLYFTFKPVPCDTPAAECHEH